MLGWGWGQLSESGTQKKQLLIRDVQEEWELGDKYGKQKSLRGGEQSRHTPHIPDFLTSNPGTGQAAQVEVVPHWSNTFLVPTLLFC